MTDNNFEISEEETEKQKEKRKKQKVLDKILEMEQQNLRTNYYSDKDMTRKIVEIFEREF
jgi:sortase (surface protein transpeptidase)